MSATPATRFRTAKKVLLLGADRVGDMLFSTPAIKMLHDVRPDLTMDVIVFSNAAKQVMLHNPAIGRIHVSPNRWRISRIGRQYDMTVAVYDGKKALRCARYLDNVFLYSRKAERIPMKMHPAFFVQHLLDEPELPIPEYYQLHPQQHHFVYVKRLLEKKGVDLERDLLVCCHMGCLRVAKRGARFFKAKNVAGVTKSWAFDNFTSLAEQLQQLRPDIKLVLTGTRGEKRIARKYLRDRPNIVDLIGQTSVLDLAALMKYCDKLLSADTGPLHIACAMDTPVVALFGKSDPAIYGPLPLTPYHRVIRKSKNVDDITVAEVREALLQE